MVQLPMLFEKYRAELIQARELRQKKIDQLGKSANGVVIVISTSVPGVDKYPSGIESLFKWAILTVKMELGITEWLAPVIYDVLGPYSICTSDIDEFDVKRRCVAIEEMTPAARLLDLDVYTKSGQQLGRREMGLGARKCLICDDRAIHCIRNKKHTQQHVRSHVSKLLQ